MADLIDISCNSAGQGVWGFGGTGVSVCLLQRGGSSGCYRGRRGVDCGSLLWRDERSCLLTMLWVLRIGFAAAECKIIYGNKIFFVAKADLL